MFEWLYHPAAGLVNFAPRRAPDQLARRSALALPGLILADVWRTMPFVALLCYARLLGIPGELYEAAQVDGAGRAAMFRRSRCRCCGRILLIAALFRTLDALRAFDLMFVLTARRPRGHHGDADRLRVPEPVPDAAARLRLGRRRGRLRAGDAGGLGLSPRAARGAAPREADARGPRARLAVLLLLVGYAVAVLLAGPDLAQARGGAAASLPPLLPSRLTWSTTARCSSRA